MATAKKKVAAKPAAKKPAAKPAAKAAKPAAKAPAKKPAAKPAKKAAAKPASNASYKKRTPKEAAQHLTLYVKDKNADLGKKGAPSAFVKAAQVDMGGVAADGIFGPKTKARAASLLGASPAKAASTTKPAAKDTTPIAKAAMLAPPEPGEAVASSGGDDDDDGGDVPASASGTDDDDDSPEMAPAYGPSVTSPVALPGPIASIQPQVMTSVAPAVSSIGSDAKSEIIAALQTFARQPEKSKDDLDALVTQLSDKFAPQLKNIFSQLEVAQLQRQATTEHNMLVKSDERWLKNNQNQQAILDKLAELVKVLTANSAMSRRIYAVYGIHV